MSRALRVNYEGAFYHVMNRGRGKMNIFRSDKDIADFLRLIGECCQQYQVSVVAYCLMSNHYHLLLCTPHANLPDFMRQLNGVYTQVFNRRYKKDGSLFRGRYLALVVQCGFYLLRVVRYIHLNPLKARMVCKIDDYPWSSHLSYIKKAGKKSWLNFAQVMNCDWMPGKKGLLGYREFLKQPDDKKLEMFYRARKKKWILGDADYQDDITQKHILSRRYYGKEIPEVKKIWQKAMMELVEKNVCFKYKIKNSALKTTMRGVDNEARKMAIRLLREQAGIPNQMIAKRYGIGNERSVTVISGRMKLKCLTDAKVGKRYQSLRASLQVET